VTKSISFILLLYVYRECVC